MTSGDEVVANGAVSGEIVEEEQVVPGEEEIVDDVDDRESKIEQFKKLLAEGKRAYITNDMSSALEPLSDAAQLSVELYGNFAPEAYEPHLYYGKTLLECCRMEDDVLSTAFKGLQMNSLGGQPQEVEDPEDETLSDHETLTDDEVQNIVDKVSEALMGKVDFLSEPVIKENGVGENLNGTKEVQGCEEKLVKENGRAPDMMEEKEILEAVQDKDKSDEAKQKDDEIDEIQRVKDSKTENDEKEGDSKSENNDEKAEDSKSENDDKKEGNSTTQNGNNIEESRAEEKVEEGEHINMEEEKDEILEDDEQKDDSNVDDEELSNKSDDEEDVDQLQLAWETLEVARAISEKFAGQNGWEERNADVLMALADCSVENEQYERALEDYTASIEIQKRIYSRGDRRLAYSLFCKGRALSLNKQFAEASELYQLSKEVLEARLSELKSSTVTNDDDRQKIDDEICELEGIIPDVDSKVFDAKESAAALANSEKKNEETAKAREPLPEDAPITDLSSSLRRKLKRNEDDIGEIEPKRKRNENGSETAVIDS